MAFSTSSIAAIKGDTGATGATGPTGLTGPAGTIDLTADQTWTGSQRGAIVGADTGVFSLLDSNNFSCTPTVNIEFQFDDITAGQSGFIYLDNSSGKAITSETTSVMVDADILTTISATGKYLLSYFAVSSSKAAITGSKAVS